MKPNTLIKIISLIAFTSVTHAQNNSATDQAIAAELKKVYQTEHGVQIRYASKESLDTALKNFKGPVTVDFGDKKLQAQGGVVIGSGADGLVATNNVDGSSPIVVRPPLTPKMSLTVVGTPSKYGEFCLTYIEKDQNGNILQGGSSLNSINQPTYVCNTIGLPVRLKKAGLYRVQMQDHHQVAGVNYVEVLDNENKIIFLRELVLPPTGNDQKVSFSIYRDLESSNVEQDKITLFSYAEGNPCNRRFEWGSECHQPPAKSSLAEYRKLFNLVTHGDGYSFELRSNKYTEQHKQSLVGVNVELKQESVSLYILSGVYGIVWNIDGQIDVTKGIYVP